MTSLPLWGEEQKSPLNDLYEYILAEYWKAAQGAGRLKLGL